MSSSVEANLTSLTTEQLFADVSASGFPQPDLSQPPEAYADILRSSYNDLAQVAIINGLWDLAGLADINDSKSYSLFGAEAARTFDSIDTMRVGFQLFAAERTSRAGNLLLRYARGFVDTADLPTELLFIDPLQIPVRAPKNGTKEHAQFGEFIQRTLGLSSADTNDEAFRVLDMLDRNIFTYIPSELFISYMKIAAALPDAKIPDEVGTLIFDVRHR